MYKLKKKKPLLFLPVLQNAGNIKKKKPNKLFLNKPSQDMIERKDPSAFRACWNLSTGNRM